MKLAIMLAVAGVTAVFTAASAQPSQSENLENVRGLVAEYQQALNEDDLEAAMALYAPDAVYMPDGAPTQVGTEAIEAYYRSNVFGQSGRHLEFDVLPVIVSADFAIVRTEIGGTRRRAEAATLVPVSSKSVFVLRRIGDGSWRIVLYVFNASD